MFRVQAVTILFFLSIYTVVLLLLVNKFKFNKKLLVVFEVPLTTFCLGYLLRLTGNQALINLGYFLTDSSGMFLSILFAFFLMLGQIKYWNK